MRIQQLQSYSTLDGPGTRFVVFTQGCPMGCIFCQNPDSWDCDGGEEFTVAELLRKMESCRSFLTESGLTITGGEPLFQAEEVQQLMTEAQADGWHVALDTSGWGDFETFRQMAQQADLLIFSIKHSLYPSEMSRSSLEDLHRNLAMIASLDTPVRVRYVLIPGWSDAPDELTELAELVKKLPNLEKLELLPFNNLCKDKWDKLNWDSPVFLDDTKISEERLREIEDFVFSKL